MLGGYQLVQRISEGASAEVFLARPDDTEERVIVEVIRPELFRETELVARFLDEAQARKALAHPNVARRVHEGTAADGRPFLVSEALGENLQQRLGRVGPMSPEQLVKLAIPVCDALHYLHQRGMVHGNLAPSAVYLGVEGLPQRPKLIDYGLALFRPGRTLPRPEGRILVDPAYLSPERIRGQRATVSCDLYALGVLLYEALKGEPPFRGAPTEVRKRHLFESPPPLPPGCEALWPIISRCLEKSPEDRFLSALAVRDALADQLDGTLPLPPPLSTLSSPSADGPSCTDVSLPERGDKVGRYTLLEAIGEGAMGRVFLARHTRLGRTVALKLLKPEHSHNREQVERFVREARAVNRIRNEHIVEIFDLVDEELPQGGRRVYCVMELLHGRSLGDALAEAPLPLSRALNIIRQVATALDAAHHAGVVHRDIKPDNVFLVDRSGDEFAKVVDFGVAKLREGTEASGAATVELPPTSLSQTAAGTVVGTPTYMAPEQVLGRPIDARVDVYALGTVLYKLVAGRTPFTAADFTELSHKIAFEAPPPLPAVSLSGEPVPPALAVLVEDCLQKDPAQRPQSAAELAARIDTLDELLQKSAPKRASEKFGTHGGRRGLWLSLGATAAIALSALGIIAVGAWPFPFGAEEPEITVVPDAAAQAAGADIKLMLYSEPPFAVVTRLDTGERLGRTPVQLVVPRVDEPLALRFEHSSYRPVELYVDRGADASAHVVLRPETRRKRKARGRAKAEIVAPDTPGPAPLRP